MNNVVSLEPKSKPAVPEFITRSDVEKMSDEDLDALVAAIRTRRLNSYLVYKQTKAEKDALERDKTQARIEKKCEQIIKKLNAVDKHMDDLEKYISELRGLRLQAGLGLV